MSGELYNLDSHYWNILEGPDLIVNVSEKLYHTTNVQSCTGKGCELWNRNTTHIINEFAS